MFFSKSQSGHRRLLRPLKLVSLILFLFFIVYQLYCYILLNEESITGPSRKRDRQLIKSSYRNDDGVDDDDDDDDDEVQQRKPNTKFIPELVWSPISTVNNFHILNLQKNSYLKPASLPQLHNFPHPHLHDSPRLSHRHRINVQQIVGISPESLGRYRSAFQYKSGYFRCIDSSEQYIELSYFNDDFCDCSDGSDEPSTSACSTVPADSDGQSTRFYCKSPCTTKPGQHQSIFYSQVNDGICDCCDGSDELTTLDLSPSHHFHQLTSLLRHPVHSSDLFRCFAKVSATNSNSQQEPN